MTKQMSIEQQEQLSFALSKGAGAVEQEQIVGLWGLEGLCSGGLLEQRQGCCDGDFFFNWELLHRVIKKCFWTDISRCLVSSATKMLSTSPSHATPLVAQKQVSTQVERKSYVIKDTRHEENFNFCFFSSGKPCSFPFIYQSIVDQVGVK